MFNLGLKCAYEPSQLYNRLGHNPDLIEIQLLEDTLFGRKRIELEETVKMLKSLGKKVYLHHPIYLKGKELDIIHNDQQIYHFYHLTTRMLVDICQEYDIKCVIHPHYVSSPSSDISPLNKRLVFSEIQHILRYSSSCFLWENTIEGLFSGANVNWIEDFVKPLNLPVVYDISHGFIAFKGNNERLIEEIEKLSPYIKYFHVVDSFGLEHDSLPLGKGGINWSPILPYIQNKPYIYEIGLKNFNDATEMIESHKFVLNLINN